MTIRTTGLDGDVLAWRDILHDGPVPAGLGPSALRDERARFLAEAGHTERAAARRELAARDAMLARSRQRYVLWFEADLYDQLQLIQVLDRLAEAGVEPTRIELVSAGEYPGVAHFGGLGELAADGLVGLHEQRVALGPDSIALARRAWAAFRSPEPTALSSLTTIRTRELRFLGEAIGRLLEEYPWVGDGLSLTERRLLAELADGEATAGALFRRVWARERRPFLGDTPFYARLRSLAECPRPLVELAGDASAPIHDRHARLSDVGRRVLSGEADHGELNGVARWIGGVHLTGAGQWRYDPRRETVGSQQM
jgi:hypothetical protein